MISKKKMSTGFFKFLELRSELEHLRDTVRDTNSANIPVRNTTESWRPQEHGWIQTVLPDTVPASKIISSMWKPQRNSPSQEPMENTEQGAHREH